MAADKKPAADANKPAGGASGKEPSKPTGTAPSTSKDAGKDAPAKPTNEKKTTDVEDLVNCFYFLNVFYLKSI